MPSDRDLMQQITKQDAGAFRVLFERYQAILNRHLVGIVHDEAAAQNLLQEVFLRVWTRAGQWSGRGPVKAWLYRIATNLALNHLRTVRRRREQPLEVPMDWDDEEEEHTVPAWMIDNTALGPEQAAELAEQMEQFRHLVARLPEEKREVLRLVHEMEMSIQDVANELGIPAGTVKSRLYYARKRLARDWQGIEKL